MMKLVKAARWSNLLATMPAIRPSTARLAPDSRNIASSASGACSGSGTNSSATASITEATRAARTRAATT